mgnify:CR=1 FL=1
MRRYGPYIGEQERLDKMFTYHPPKDDQAERYNEIRGGAKALAAVILALTPFSEEQNTALEKLSEVMFWANAAIARNEQ